MRNVIVAILTLSAWLQAGEVVVYVSLDQEHSAKVLKDFEKETGIEVRATYDTEANKTVGMVNKLILEKSDPQADVYWNNELATTIKLKERGVIQPYTVPSAASIPTAFKDPDGYWIGFAARARVLIVNTDLVSADDFPKSMWDLAEPKWRGKVCMARPETGTTAAHAVALYVADQRKADDYFDRLIANDLVWLTGNAHCMREVKAGRFAFGWTDTDDFHVALLQGAPVARVFPDKGPDEAGVMYIPNSLVLVKDCKHPETGKKLIDWLLRPATEARLAKGSTAQIPVRPDVPVPDHVRRPDQVGKTMPVDWDRVGKEYDKWVGHVRARLAGAEESSPVLIWIVVCVVAVAVAVVIFLKKATGETS
jgi:iron(III) transport system substrate-binding protein